MKLFSKIYGKKGQDLIIIHGLFGMSDNWDSLGRQFSKYCRVHLIDLRNHGRSPHAQEFNYDVMCEDILEYMQDNSISKPIVLGHSLGGKVGMKIAFSFPNKIDKLIVVDIAPREYNTDFIQDFLQNLHKLSLQDFEKREEVDQVLSETLENREMRLFLLKNLYRNQQKEFAWRFNLDVLLEKVNNIQEADFIEGICDIPTYFLRGYDSNYITAEDELIINKHFSDYSISTIDGAGHWLHVQQSERFYNEVMGFRIL